MSQVLSLDEDTYAMIEAYAKNQHCSLTTAVRRLLIGIGPQSGKMTSFVGVADYQLPARSLKVRADLDLTKLAHADEDG